MTSLPVWAIPPLLVVLGLTWLVGRLSPAPAAVATLAALLAVAYLPSASRRRRDGRTPPANLLGMLPGHLLLLLAISRAPSPDPLAWGWTSLPLLSVLYDILGSRRPRAAPASILIGLYGILWIVVLVLLERLISGSRGLTGLEEAMVALGLAAVAAVFVVTGIARHRRAGKES
ncbi:MAG: hypothetical protein AB1778_04355 [Candidatus Bipolaricaulota bacterium]